MYGLEVCDASCFDVRLWESVSRRVSFNSGCYIRGHCYKVYYYWRMPEKMQDYWDILMLETVSMISPFVWQVNCGVRSTWPKCRWFRSSIQTLPVLFIGVEIAQLDVDPSEFATLSILIALLTSAWRIWSRPPHSRMPYLFKLEYRDKHGDIL